MAHRDDHAGWVRLDEVPALNIDGLVARQLRSAMMSVMMDKLKEMLERVESWPAEAQERAADALLTIEAEYAAAGTLSAEDLDAIERSAADVRLGRLATDEQAEKVFGRYRRA